MNTVLETKGLIKRFGGIVATDNVSLAIEKGARHALIGPNGAGKTTLVNQLTGVLMPTEGTIKLDGIDVTRFKRSKRVKLGLVRTFQINQLFRTLSPRETLILAISEREGAGWNLVKSVAKRSAFIKEAEKLAIKFGLSDVFEEPTYSLPYGKQRLLEIAVAVACKPRVLLLDEPAAGVPEAERAELLKTIAELPSDVTVLLIEHDMDLVFRFADRVSVMVNGKLFADGKPEDIAADPRVREVYLGAGDD